mmetsp:Transcript_3899/g.8444  ORF Transcript_3899/g.8444 Transcript_3899/m.8444 type:complete len:237 (-) Transcript_3899:916-1626(-)
MRTTSRAPRASWESDAIEQDAQARRTLARSVVEGVPQARPPGPRSHLVPLTSRSCAGPGPWTPRPHSPHAGSHMFRLARQRTRASRHLAPRRYTPLLARLAQQRLHLLGRGRLAILLVVRGGHPNLDRLLCNLCLRLFPPMPLLGNLRPKSQEDDADTQRLHVVHGVGEEKDGKYDGEQLPDRLDGGEDERAVLFDGVEDEELPHGRAYGHDQHVVQDQRVGHHVVHHLDNLEGDE